MIKLILAVDDVGGIGKDNTLPWPHNSTDLKRFKALTSGHVVVMGSKTWNAEGMPKPLPNRVNYIFSNTMTEAKGANIVNGDVERALEIIALKHMYKDIWVIGGSTLVDQCWDMFREMYITRIPGDFNCDTKINIDRLNKETVSQYQQYPELRFEKYKR